MQCVICQPDPSRSAPFPLCQVVAPRFHEFPSPLEQIRAHISSFDAVGVDVSKRCFGNRPRSVRAFRAQSRNDERKPFGTACMFSSRSSFSRVLLLSGPRAGDDGKINPLLSDNDSASPSTTHRGQRARDLLARECGKVLLWAAVLRQRRRDGITSGAIVFGSLSLWPSASSDEISRFALRAVSVFVCRIGTSTPST